MIFLAENNMNITIEKAFDIICTRLEKALEPQGFTKQKVDSTGKELVSLFTGETTAYSVSYISDKSYMVLRICTMTDEGPDNQWKTVATWMYNPQTDSTKEAESIGNDFADNVTSPTAIKKMRQTKKKKSDDQGNADPIFLAKRFVAFFPELKEEIKNEYDCYYPFRGVTFTRASIVPRVNQFLLRATQKEVDKLSQMLSTQYSNGDVDTRSIITIVILNSVDESYKEALKSSMSQELIKAWEAAEKYKGKKVKPEVRKQKKMTIGERLTQQQ